MYDSYPPSGDAMYSLDRLTVVVGTLFLFCFSRTQGNVNVSLFDIHTQFQAPLSQKSFEINTDLGICLPGEKVFAKIVELASPI